MTQPPWREFHCVPSQGRNDTGYCVSKSEHGAIKGLCIHTIEFRAYEELREYNQMMTRELESRTKSLQEMLYKKDVVQSRVTELEKVLEKFVNIDDSSKLPLVEHQGQSKLDRYEWAVVCARQALSKERGK